jgi:outer membrane biosynthesis protein TonB
VPVVDKTSANVPTPPPVDVVKPKDTGKKPVVKVKPDKQPEVKQPEVKQPEVVKPVEPPVEVKAVGITSGALVAQYSTVGRDLKALGDKAADLWPRYRRIQLNDALATAATRSEASAILSELSKTAATRK